MPETTQVTTYDEIVAVIDAFTELYLDAAYSFAHIVLGDFNLGDNSIHYCLESSRIDEWMEGQKAKIVDWNVGNEYGLAYDLERLERMKTETVALLNWLLTIPEAIREDD